MATALNFRDRFVGFAFAAADVLAEVDSNRLIVFAAGALQERFGIDGDGLKGQPFSRLIAPEDQGALEIAMTLVAARGRLPPVSLRLANAERTHMALAGLRLPHRLGVSWLTLARIPAPMPPGSALAAAAVFREAMDARSRSGADGQMGLLEVKGWSDLDSSQRRDLEGSIAHVLQESGGAGAVATEVSEGRFGVLANGAMDIADLQAQIGGVLSSVGAARLVAAISIPMAADLAAGKGETAGAARAEAMRAMRFALTCFTSGGAHAVLKTGLDGGVNSFLNRTQERAAAVRSAIERGRFRLVFQPVVRLHDRSVHHYEALLRPLPIAGHEDTNTQEYVSFAEAVGLAETLDLAVLGRAGEALKSARARVAVNVSGISMQGDKFRETMLRFIADYPDAGRRFMVELTETADIDDLPSAVATVAQLAAAGIPVCLDDFGAGYAAFRYLREFKVDFVKIDGSFVLQATAGSREGGFVSAMVELARCVGAETIAETVETEAQATAMQNLGVQFGQGWLFGRPGTLPGSR